jgi:hypothetical protein
MWSDALSRSDVWQTAVTPDALTSPILILGAPRSGTTWLAKIIDSHPDVLYRHEPDKVGPSPSPLTAHELPALLVRWVADRDAHAVTKQPYFRKSWQPGWARGVRTVLATAVSAAALMPPPFKALAGLQIPDMASRPARRVAIKSVGWAEGAAVLARTLPDSRTIFILRHPCAQVASVMHGNRQRRFELKTAGTNMPFNQVRTSQFAASHGVTEREFHALSDAAKYGWNWRALNEPTYAALAELPNVHVVLYEALCAQPDALARRIVEFAGLNWNRQTEKFVARSTSHRGKAGYYTIFRNAATAADAWRSSMPPSDQAAVRSVVAASPLARFWPDIMNAV